MKNIKKISLLVLILLLICSITNITKAASGDFGKVSNVSPNAEVTLTGEGTNDVFLNYSVLKLDHYDSDPSIGRDYNGYSVGFRIDYPESLGGASASEDEVKKVKYHNRFVGYEWSEDKSFYTNRDGKWYLCCYSQVTPQIIESHTSEFILTETEFDWTGDGVYDQKVSIKITPTGVTLDETNVTKIVIKQKGNGATDGVLNFSMTTGKSINEGLLGVEKEYLENLKKTEGFVKFYKEGAEDTEFSFDEKITDSEITLIALFDKKVEQPESTTDDDDKEKPENDQDQEEQQKQPEQEQEDEQKTEQEQEQEQEPEQEPENEVVESEQESNQEQNSNQESAKENDSKDALDDEPNTGNIGFIILGIISIVTITAILVWKKLIK